MIIPVHKKDDRSQISNYRGIALLSPFSKIYEKSFQSRLLAYLGDENILIGKQFGFRKGCSTQHAVLSLYNYILNNLDLKNNTACIFFYLKRAFDTVNLNLLLLILNKYGIKDNALNWVKSYLVDRTQEVAIRNGYTIFKSNTSQAYCYL